MRRCKMSSENTKSNRISDDSGVVCFNTTADELLLLNDSFSSSSSATTSSSAMFLTSERQRSNESSTGNQFQFQYQSVYANKPASSGIVKTTAPCTATNNNKLANGGGGVKRREKRGNYVIGSGIVATSGNPDPTTVDPAAGPGGKYGSKRLTHVQQMRERFENLCKINKSNEIKRCEAVNCKGGVRGEEQFDSLPIIPFGKNSGGGGGDRRTTPTTPKVDSPLIEFNNGVNSLVSVPHQRLDKLSSVEDNHCDSPTAEATLTQQLCECSDDNNETETEAAEDFSFLGNGSTISLGEKVLSGREDFSRQESHRTSGSDFEEDPEGHSGNSQCFEVKNATLCEITDEDDFQDVLLEELVTEADASNARPDSLNKTFTNLLNIVDELLSCEQTYISSLEAGVKNYKLIFRDPETIRNLPDSLRGQEGVIFGNIDRICDFHRDELFPKLLECDRNVTKICEVFCDFIQKDYFYKYVLYAMNRNKSENVCSQNTEFFKRRQEEIGDRLGLNSFLVKPIQRLPHYGLLFNQMIVELLKGHKGTKDESLKALIATCCRTEKYMKKLNNSVNESMHINDIEECYEFNLLHQGKFRKMDSFEIFEKYSNYRYKARMFLFDKSLVYTESKPGLKTGKSRLFYKGHYLRTKIGMEPDRTATSQSKKLILFSEKLGQQCIEVTSSDFPHVIYEWKVMIDDIIRSFIVEERERVRKGQRPNRAVTLRGTPITPELRSTSRGSVISVKSLASDISSLSGTSSSGSDRSSKISVDSRLGILPVDAEIVNRRTTWDDQKYIDKLLSAEKTFLRVFVDNKKFYVDDQPDHAKDKLEFFIKRFDDIFWFHTQLCEEITGCGQDVEKVCELFKTHLKLGNFEVFNKYAVTLGRAESIISETKEPVGSNFYTDRVSLKQFLQLPMKKLTDYLATFNEILDESFSNGGTMTSLFKHCAVIEVEFNQLHRRTMENYRLYALRDERMHYKIHGQVEHSDVVSFNALNVLNYKLLLTKTTLICVQIKSSSYKEKFLSIFFLIPLKHLTMKESKVKPNRLKFASAETRLMHRVIFAKQDKKETFQRMIGQFQRKIFRLE